jgi:hypothetical protein
MRLKNTRRFLEASFGACVIYTVMAACNGGGNGNASSSGGGGHGHGGHGHGGGAPGGGGTAGSTMAVPGGSDGAGIFDALTDPVHDAMADPVSGTRLKAAWIESLDGARQYLLNTEPDYGGTGFQLTTNVWFDSMRSETCVFRLAVDGKLRCLPGLQNAQAGQVPGFYQLFYADDTCSGSSAYFIMDPPQTNCAQYTPPTYGLLIEPSPTTCHTPGEDGRFRVFKVGAQLTLPSNTPYYFPYGQPGQAPTCQKVDDINSILIVYAAAEVDITKFQEVDATVKHE